MKLNVQKPENISICEHPLALHNLNVLRNKNSSSEVFRNALKRLAYILFFSATDNLPTFETEIETPITTTNSKMICQNSEIIIAPILRAGLLFSDVASEILPSATVQHIGMYRDEERLEPVWYYNKTPIKFKSPETTFVYILDPMLATGGSAVEAIKLYTNKQIPQKNIRFVSLLSAPEGITAVQNSFPDVKVITAWIDLHLNEKGYIVPGLGDAGDRTFNTLDK